MRRAQWLGKGQAFFVVDTPGLSDPEGREIDNRHIKNVIRLLKDEVREIHAFVLVIKGSENRALPSKIRYVLHKYQL